MAKIDEKDRQTINAILKVSGFNQRRIAEELGITAPAVNNRLQRLREKGVILGSSPIIALAKVGYDLTAIVNVRVKPGKMAAAEKKWAKDTNVCSLYRISGDYDIMIIAKFRSMGDLDKWSDRIFDDAEIIERTNTSIAFGAEKEGVNPNRVE